MNKNLFELSGNERFAYLHESNGFSTAVTEDYGLEIFVQFERGAQTVSISYESGGRPLIELF